MTRLRRGISIAGSVFIVAGLVAAVAVRPAGSGSDALAAPTVQGTDIYGQTTVTSWPDVKSAGASFVGVQAYDGATVPNRNYGSQVTGALAAGLYVMPYVFADPLKIAGGAQFTRAWAVIGAIPAHPYAAGGQLLPIAVDLENDPEVTSEYCYGFTPAKMVSWIAAFITAAKARTGVVPIIYTSKSWWNKCTGKTTAFKADPLWVAEYGVSSPALPSGWTGYTGYTFWQDSDSVAIGGISGAADLDQLQTAPTVMAPAGSGGFTQLETLNSLAGQPVSYARAVVLPAGVALTSAGRLSWSSATRAGRYQVIVTPASRVAAAVPGSVAVTLRVHAPITLYTASRSSVAGAPVKLAIPFSGADAQAGFAPVLRVTGLPAGLSVRSASLVTGWAYRPGRYQVTVRAADALGGTGSASFAWIVRAAADSGSTGPVRQVGGSGKCLNDPGGNTANGTRLTLWSCTGKSNQRWTTVQDGTLRTGGKCLRTVGGSSSSGAGLQLAGCDAADGAQHWLAGTDGELVNPRSGRCLAVQAARAVNGTQPVIENCASSTGPPNEHWLRPAGAIASGQPGTCMAASGTAAVLTNCRDGAAQHGQPRSDGTIRLNGKCLVIEATTVRSPLSVGSCAGAAAQWQLVSAGPVATQLLSTVSGLCASVPATGARLVIAGCGGTLSTTWHVG